jgi:predicted nucleic acid-binding protein
MRFRVYLDTSVLGGLFDEEFEEDTERLFSVLADERFQVFVSEIAVEEVQRAPERVRAKIVDALRGLRYEKLQRSAEAEVLARRYIAAGVLTGDHLADAEHVALATVTAVQVVISWNFRHMVNVFKQRAFNEVNLREGFGAIDLKSPLEFIHEES